MWLRVLSLHLQAVQKQVEKSEVPLEHITKMMRADAPSDEDSDSDYEAEDEIKAKKKLKSKNRRVTTNPALMQ